MREPETLKRKQKANRTSLKRVLSRQSGYQHCVNDGKVNQRRERDGVNCHVFKMSFSLCSLHPRLLFPFLSSSFWNTQLFAHFASTWEFKKKGTKHLRTAVLSLLFNSFSLMSFPFSLFPCFVLHFRLLFGSHQPMMILFQLHPLVLPFIHSHSFFPIVRLSKFSPPLT